MISKKLNETLENLQQILAHLNAGLDELFEKIKEIQTHQEEQDKQLAKLFNLYREMEIDLSDIKRDTDKIKTIRILDEINEESTKLEGVEECEETKKQN